MAKVITTELQHSGASAANITLDSSKNVTCENNLTVDGTTTLTGAVTLPAGTTQDTLSFRNLIINGAMQVYQRGAATTTHNSFAADRFKYSTSGCDENPTLERIALTSSDTGPWAQGFRFSNQFTNGNQTSGAGVGDYIRLMQRIEGQNIAQSGWDYTSSSSYITLSFWVKSSIAQNFYGYIYTADGTAQSYPFETGSLSANTWTKITKTIPGNSNITMDSDTGEGLRITFVPFYGTNLTASPTLNTWAAYSATAVIPDMTSTWYTTNDSTFAITGVQLEVGSTATDYEHRSYGDEYLRCARYFHRIEKDSGQAWSVLSTSAVNRGTNNTRCFFKHPVPLRAIASWAISDVDDTRVDSSSTGHIFATNTPNSTTLMASYSTKEQTCVDFGSADTNIAIGHASWLRSNNAAVTLDFSAEL